MRINNWHRRWQRKGARKSWSSVAVALTAYSKFQDAYREQITKLFAIKLEHLLGEQK